MYRIIHSGPSAPKDVAAQIVARLTPSNLVQSTTVMVSSK